MNRCWFVLLLSACSAQIEEAPEEEIGAAADAVALMCYQGQADPGSADYSCVPEFVACGRQCTGDCEKPGRDTWVCSAPPAGGGPWAPPNCELAGLSCRANTRRYCCSCE